MEEGFSAWAVCGAFDRTVLHHVAFGLPGLWSWVEEGTKVTTV